MDLSVARTKLESQKLDLQSKRRVLMKDLATVSENSAGTTDSADCSSALTDQSLVLAHLKSNAEKLNRIRMAEDAVRNDEYGYCSECGEGIPVSKMVEMPTTIYCFECHSGIEKFPHSQAALRDKLRYKNVVGNN